MNTYYEVKYHKDKVVVFKGMKVDEDSSALFGTTDLGSFGDYTEISEDSSLKVITTYRVEKENLTKFYLVPSISNEDNFVPSKGFDDNDIYYIFKSTNIFDTNHEYCFSVIELKNIQNNLAQSGQVIEQFIQFGSPGQGYLFPKLIFNNERIPID